MSKKKIIHNFRIIAIAEGVSFLVLLGIAMPLKYLFHFPEAVKICGWIHGVLFAGYVFFAFHVMTGFDKKLGWLAKAFLAAVLPFGTFVLDRELKKEESASDI